MSDQKPSETRAVILDLIEKAERFAAIRRAVGADLEDYMDRRELYRASTYPETLLPLLALALKGLDAEEQIEFLKHDIAEREP